MESDLLLSELITRTSANPGLARDLLEAHSWDMKSALGAYYVMKGMMTPEENDNDGLISKSLPTPRIMITELKNNLNGGSKSPSITSSACREERKGGRSVTGNSTGSVGLRYSSEPSLSSPASSKGSSVNSSPFKLNASRSELNGHKGERELDIVPRKLFRGISRATDNVNLVSKARNEFAEDFKCWTSERVSRWRRRKSSLKEDSPVHLKDCAPEYTFTLPDLSIHAEDFRTFLEKDLIEKSTLISLESSGRLNWWSDLGASQKLWPLATTGDGNCLLHAASLGMWGFHDRLLTLRRALHEILMSERHADAFYRRWRWQTSLQNRESGLILSEEEWKSEWGSLLKMASTEPRVRAATASKSSELNGGKKTDILPEDEAPPHVYESLEEMHISALAHVLQRPIIVTADTMLKDVKGEPFAPIPFGGIYLPLQCDPEECHRSPLCLTYDSAHFSALVSMDKETYADRTPHPPAVIPLTGPDRKLLPIQFAVDPGSEVKWEKEGEGDVDWAFLIKKLTLTDKDKLGLLREYLDVRHTQVPNNRTAIAVEEPTVKKVSNRNMEKSHTLPSNFEFDETDSGKLDSAMFSSAGKSRVGNHSKAVKQLQNITKHFGSLGRSMSKRIKRNLGNLARRSTSFKSNKSNSSNDSPKRKRMNSGNNSSEVVGEKGEAKVESCRVENIFDNAIISALLHTQKRHEYHDEMIRNYLSTARIRFEQQKEKETVKKTITSGSSNGSSSRTSTSSSSNEGSSNKSRASSPDHYASQCVNEGCINYGTAATNYLCNGCFTDQKKEMMSKCAAMKEEEEVDKKSSVKVSLIEAESKLSSGINHANNTPSTPRIVN